MNRSARSVLSVVAVPIIVTVGAVTLVGPPGVAVAAPSGPTPAAPGSGPTTAYTVVNGDSLVGIANSFGIKVSALLRANDLTLVSVIQPGDVLAVPAVAPLGSPVGAPPAPAAPGSTPYQVRPGDALAGIAWTNGVTLGALVKANGLTTTSVIHAGETLQLPPATRALPAAASKSSGPSGSPNSAALSSASVVASSTSAATPPPVPSGTADAVLAYARQQVGVPYRFFAAGPDAFDCSGLVVAAYRQVDISLPHQSLALSRVGTAVDWTTQAIRPGDLVLTASTASPTVISHVGIAIDDTTWIQAVGAGRTVSVGRMPVDTKILAVRRVL